ncbi:MAG: RNA pseudouridine synthase, partial [Acetobacteraceae bacterium]
MVETLPRPAPPAPSFPVLFRDNRFLVLDKPAGLPVHAGPRGGPNVEAALRPLARGR